MRKSAAEKPIAIFDSGVGGLPYLGWLLEQLPAERYLYMADHAHFPYGEKSTAELREIIPAAVAKLIEAADPKMVVIACNTASVVALRELRQRFGIPFVGVVPAVKPAAEQSLKGRLGVFATRRTIEDPYTDDLISRFAGELHVARYAEGRIVDMVEHSYFSTGRRERLDLLRPAAEFFLREEVDYLVLACTHFVFLRDELEELLEHRVTVIDSREGVGRQVIRILHHENLAADPGSSNGRGRFYMTGVENREAYRPFAEHFGLEWGGAV